MKSKLCWILVLAWLLAPAAQGQLLWKISGHDLKKPSYLFGTHHLIDKSLIPNFDSILSICGQSDAVVGEMDMKTPGLQRKMMQNSVMKGKNIRDLVSETDYSMLDKEFKSLMGLGMNMLGSFKPMMLMTMHQMTLYIKSSESKKQPVSVDELFQKQARARRKPVIGLETPEFQMKVLFDAIPLDRQAEMLLYEVREKERILLELGQLKEAYVTGDLEQMNAMDAKDDSMKPEERKLLVDDRNVDWLRQLPALLQRQSCFVAVGCLHLVGENGLINQLRTKGYSVEPVLFR